MPSKTNPPDGASAAENPLRPISVRVGKVDEIRTRLAEVEKHPLVEARAEADAVRFAIEFAARCLTHRTDFDPTALYKIRDDKLKLIIEMAFNSISIGPNNAVSKKALFSAEALLSPSQTKDAREYITPSRNFDYSSILRDSKEIWLVFNDMYNWLGNHEHRSVLESRIKENLLRTNIFLVHPESPALNYVAAKSNKLHIMSRTGDNRQLYDIKRSLFRLLENILDNVGDKTKIIGHRWVHSYSLVMNETEAYVTPYLNKKVGNDGIIHIYRSEKSSQTRYMYRDVLDDLEDMERYTTSIPNLNLVMYAKKNREMMQKELYED